MLLRKCGQQAVHLSAGFGFESSLLRPLVGGYDIWYFGHRIRLVTGGVTMGVGDLVRSDSVDEGHEGPPLILVSGEGGHHGQTYLLRNVVRGELPTLRSADPRAAVTHHQRADVFQYLG